MHYYQFNIGDYTASTQHLDVLEDIAYRRMLDLYYSKEKPLPESVESIARLIRMRTHCECIEVVLQEFFTLESDGWHNKGADKVLSKTYAKSDKARAAANKRWSKNKELKPDANAMQTHFEGNADGMQPNTQYPIPNTKDKEESNSPERVTCSKPPVPYGDIVDAYHDILPMCPSISAMTDSRKSKVRRFWKKFGFTLDSWKSYLRYISANCRWMLEDRPNGKGGFWRCKNLEYFVTEKCYLSVKEDRASDQ